MEKINVATVVARASHLIHTSFRIKSISKAPVSGKNVVTVNTGKSRLFKSIFSIFSFTVI